MFSQTNTGRRKPPAPVAGVARGVKLLLALAVFVSALAALIPGYIYLASEALVQRRYPLASTTVRADLTPKQVRRGAHLVAITGCADCHGPKLTGRLLYSASPLPVYAGNLLRSAKAMSDGELERAIRYAVAPDATSLWGMPSGSYRYLSEDDVASLVSWLRSRPPDGPARPPPRFAIAARLALLKGTLEPAAAVAADSPSSLDMGPRYDGGRYLARIACGECHGTDLNGTGAAPDLNRIVRYDRPAFFALLREGRGADASVLPAMHRLARVRFRFFADYEIMALYEYLWARAHAPADLIARAEALRRHDADERRLQNTAQ